MDISSTEEYESSEDEEIETVPDRGAVPKILPEHSNPSNAGQFETVLSGECSETSTETGRTNLIHQVGGNAISQSRRPKVQLTPAYHALLDEFRPRKTLESNIDVKTHLHSSQIGLTVWSSKEKELFFSVLPRQGRNDIQGIARAIGSKSEPEICIYMQHLQRKTTQFGYSSQPQLVSIGDIPAASEISKNVNALLNDAAKIARSEETELHESLEREIFGDFWLLDYKFASNYDQKTVEDKSAMYLDDKPNLQRSMQLLDLYNFLELSLRFFMNSHKPKDNWRAYSEKGETPSLYASALIAFHDLVVDITKRVISSALFFAMARLRDESLMQYVEQHRLGGFVRKDDVLAAVNILGLKSNKQKLWLGVARRCNLHVYKEVTRRGVGLDEPLSYEEIENCLMESRSRTPSVALSPVKNETVSSKIKNPSTQQDVFHNAGDDTSNFSDSLESTSSDAYEKEQVQDAESLDNEASRQEERRLLDVLKNKKRLLHHDGTENNNQTKRSKTDTKRDKGSVDWRNWLEYQSPWERYKHPVPEADFARNQTLNRSKHVSPISEKQSKVPRRRTRRSRQRSQPKSRELIPAEDDIDSSEVGIGTLGSPAVKVDINDEDAEGKEVLQSFPLDMANRDTENLSHGYEMRDADDGYEVDDIDMEDIRRSIERPTFGDVNDGRSTIMHESSRRETSVPVKSPESEERGRTGYQQRHSLTDTDDEESEGESEDVVETDSTDGAEDEDEDEDEDENEDEDKMEA